MFGKNYGVKQLSKDSNKKYRQQDIKNVIYPEGSTVLIIDADTVAFRIASASDKKSIVVKDLKTNSLVGRFKNRTDFRKKFPKYIMSDVIIEDIIDTEPVSFCLSTLKKKINSLKTTVNADYMEIYLGGSENFRLNLPLPEKYKGQRAILKPTHLKSSQEYLINKMDCKEIIGVETDDIVQQRLVEISKQNNVKAYLATVDKDAYQVFDDIDYGIVDIKENEVKKIRGGFGRLYLTDNVSSTLKGDGFIWLMSQVFLLDSADNYKMNSHYNKRYGGKTFFKDFTGLKTHKEVLEKMKSLWLDLLPDRIEYKDFLGCQRSFSRLELAELYFSCAYMRLMADDNRSLESFFTQYGVSIEVLK